MYQPRSLISLAFFAACCAPTLPVLADDPLRLSRDVVPTFESLDLKLDPARADYSGSAHIELQVSTKTETVRFHARGLKLETIVLKGARGAVSVKSRDEQTGLVVLTAERALEPGAYTLDLHFSQAFNTRSIGLYRAVVEGQGYLFTQFEAMYARDAFPCWDEPSFKIPYQLTVSVPSEDLALSNTPVLKETNEGSGRRVEFEKTRPLPSYLLALAVGPFETVDIPGMGVPARVVTVKGQRALAAEAVRIAPTILKGLEEYFGSRYPYQKLDLVAAPEFMFGAMENPGAIVFRDNILMVNGQTAGVMDRAILTGVLTHELAHMWFGDLVTMSWWNDLWLNESFASWLTDKIVARLYPQFNVPAYQVHKAQEAMTQDTQLAARPIRQSITALDNPLQFVGMSYDKGEAVLAMFEQWIGPEKFRKGIIAYLTEHAWGNAEAADLWAALARAGGRDVAGPMSTFLDQPGVPVVTAELVGDRQVRLTQHRMVGAGVAAGPALWQIPMVIGMLDGEKLRPQTLLLTGTSQTFKLEARHPSAIHLNLGAAGYYRWSVPAEMRQTLTKSAPRALSLRERIAWLGDLNALLSDGTLKGDEYLEALAQASSDPAPEVVGALVGGLERVWGGFITETDLSDSFAAYVRKTLTPAIERMGMHPAAAEPSAVSQARPGVLIGLGAHGRDPKVLDFAREEARHYLQDPSSLDTAMGRTVLELAALEGDSALFDQYRAKFEAAKDPGERSRYLAALGWFRNPALIDRALKYSLEGPLRPHEIMTIPRTVVEASERADFVLAWVMSHYDVISARVPRDFTVFIPNLALGSSLERLTLTRTFFSDPARTSPGMARELEKLDEAVHHRIELRAREGQDVRAWLQKGAMR